MQVESTKNSPGMFSGTRLLKLAMYPSPTTHLITPQCRDNQMTRVVRRNILDRIIDDLASEFMGKALDQCAKASPLLTMRLSDQASSSSSALASCRSAVLKPSVNQP